MALGARRGKPRDPKTAIVLLIRGGTIVRSEDRRRYSQLERVIFICGRYEGVDERVAEHLATEEISIGNFVLSGGELPAMLVIDAVARLIPGALGNEASSQNESFSGDGRLVREHKVISHEPRVTRSSIIRTTRGRRSIAGGACRKS